MSKEIANTISQRMADERTTILFIKAVKRWPCLYDVTHENFKNSISTETAWNAIADEIGGNISDLKMKWKSLKDCYIKHRKSKMNNVNTKNCYRNWCWAKYLHFLEPLSNYRSRNVIRLVQRKQNQCSIKFDKEGVSSIKSEPDQEVEVEVNPQFSEVFVDSSNPTPTNNDKDDIYHLFQSYAETFRKLSPKRQIMLKFEMAKLFSTAELEQLNETMNDESII